MSDNFSRPQQTAPLTPILQLINGSPIVLVAFFAVGLSWWFLLIGVVFLFIGGLGYWASWRKHFFWINEKGELEARSGIFFRRSKQLRISRLQSVDILRPPVARLLGYSSLKVEVAGSGDSRVILSYLSDGKAQELQSEILSVAKEERTFTQSAERGNYWQWRVPNGRLVASMVLTTSTFFVIIGAVASAVIALWGGGLAALALAVGGSAASLAGITSLFNFSVGRNERGIAISPGFFTTAHYTVSPMRIRAICLVQPIAWRPFGWYRIAINVAGTDQSGKKSGPRVLIPVVHEDTLSELFRELLPSWNLETEDEWIASATISSWRFPWQAARLAVSVTPDLFVLRSGALTRRLSAAPHERIQSIRITQGPWERKLGISSLHADSVPGPVRLNARGLGSNVAVHTALVELDRMATARNSQRSDQW